MLSLINQINIERARELGLKIAKIIGMEGFERLDHQEPEYKTLKELLKALHNYKVKGGSLLLDLLSILIAVNNYQISAEKYWKSSEEVAKRRIKQNLEENVSLIDLARDVVKGILERYDQPLNKYWDAKRKRWEKIFDDGFPGGSFGTTIGLWHRRMGCWRFG